MRGPILVINAGSSSVKFSLFETAADGAPAAGAHGEVSGIGTSARFAGEDGVCLDRGPEIFAKKGVEALLDVAPQGAADINLFSGDGQLHGQNRSILEVAAYRALKRNWASRRPRSSASAADPGS